MNFEASLETALVVKVLRYRWARGSEERAERRNPRRKGAEANEAMAKLMLRERAWPYVSECAARSAGLCYSQTTSVMHQSGAGLSW